MGKAQGQSSAFLCGIGSVCQIEGSSCLCNLDLARYALAGTIQLGPGERDRLGRCHGRLADGFARTNARTNGCVLSLLVSVTCSTGRARHSVKALSFDPFVLTL